MRETTLRICPFCKKGFVSLGKHLHNCGTGNIDSDFIEAVKYNYGDDVVDNVIKDYRDNLYSLPDLYKKYNISYYASRKLLTISGVRLRTIQESAIKITSKKHKETCKLKYGVDNVSQTDFVKEKKKETFIKHYGIDNIWKTDEYKQFSRDRWNSYSFEKKTELLKGFRERHLNGAKPSLLENRIVDSFIELGIPIETQFKFRNYFHKYDIKIKGTRVLIEVNGDFWHANPRKYNPDDILNFSEVKHIKASDIWKKDREHKDYAESKGYAILYIWECDVTDLSDEELKMYLINVINNIDYEENSNLHKNQHLT